MNPDSITLDDNALRAASSLAQLTETMEFFQFSYTPTISPFNGTVTFCIALPDGNQVTRSVRVDPKAGITIFDGLPEDGKTNCQCSCSSDTFFGIYMNKIDARAAVLSGKVVVKGFAFRALSNFASSFDMSSSCWDRFYEYKAVEEEKLLQKQKLIQEYNIYEVQHLKNQDGTIDMDDISHQIHTSGKIKRSKMNYIITEEERSHLFQRKLEQKKILSLLNRKYAQYSTTNSEMDVDGDIDNYELLSPVDTIRTILSSVTSMVVTDNQEELKSAGIYLLQVLNDVTIDALQSIHENYCQTSHESVGIVPDNDADFYTPSSIQCNQDMLLTKTPYSIQKLDKLQKRIKTQKTSQINFNKVDGVDEIGEVGEVNMKDDVLQIPQMEIYLQEVFQGLEKVCAGSMDLQELIVTSLEKSIGNIAISLPTNIDIPNAINAVNAIITNVDEVMNQDHTTLSAPVHHVNSSDSTSELNSSELRNFDRNLFEISWGGNLALKSKDGLESTIVINDNGSIPTATATATTAASHNPKSKSQSKSKSKAEYILGKYLEFDQAEVGFGIRSDLPLHSERYKPNLVTIHLSPSLSEEENENEGVLLSNLTNLTHATTSVNTINSMDNTPFQVLDEKVREISPISKIITDHKSSIRHQFDRGFLPQIMTELYSQLKMTTVTAIQEIDKTSFSKNVKNSIENVVENVVESSKSTLSSIFPDISDSEFDFSNFSRFPNFPDLPGLPGLPDLISLPKSSDVVTKIRTTPGLTPLFVQKGSESMENEDIDGYGGGYGDENNDQIHSTRYQYSQDVELDDRLAWETAQKLPHFEEYLPNLEKYKVNAMHKDRKIEKDLEMQMEKEREREREREKNEEASVLEKKFYSKYMGGFIDSFTDSFTGGYIRYNDDSGGVDASVMKASSYQLEKIAKPFHHELSQKYLQLHSQKYAMKQKSPRNRKSGKTQNNQNDQNIHASVNINTSIPPVSVSTKTTVAVSPFYFDFVQNDYGSHDVHKIGENTSLQHLHTTILEKLTHKLQMFAQNTFYIPVDRTKVRNNIAKMTLLHDNDNDSGITSNYYDYENHVANTIPMINISALDSTVFPKKQYNAFHNDNVDSSNKPSLLTKSLKFALHNIKEKSQYLFNFSTLRKQNTSSRDTIFGNFDITQQEQTHEQLSQSPQPSQQSINLTRPSPRPSSYIKTYTQDPIYSNHIIQIDNQLYCKHYNMENGTITWKIQDSHDEKENNIEIKDIRTIRDVRDARKVKEGIKDVKSPISIPVSAQHIGFLPTQSRVSTSASASASAMANSTVRLSHKTPNSL